jgi:hypothetical protein
MSVGSAGCVFGAGPVVGYGKAGLFVGAEAGGGNVLLIPQGTIGYTYQPRDGNQLFYGRIDEAVDLAGTRRSMASDIVKEKGMFGGRIGGGVGIDADAHVIGVFAAGPNFGHILGYTPSGQSGNGCGEWNTVGLVEIQVRYAAGWQIVLAPRIERATAVCN